MPTPAFLFATGIENSAPTIQGGRVRIDFALVQEMGIHFLHHCPPLPAAKAALLSLTRSAALEGKAKGVRVNAILPGAVDTPMLRDNPNVRSGQEKIDPADVGKLEDIAAVIAYLASDDARFVQGAMIRVDGGRLNRL